MIQNCRCRNTRSHNGSFHFHGLRRKLIPEFLISGDLLNSLFRVVLSSSVSRLYFSWNALQKISRNSCILSPGDCMAFRTSFISSSAGVVCGFRAYITIIPYRSEIVEIFDFGAVFLLSGHTGKGSKMSYD